MRSGSLTPERYTKQVAIKYCPSAAAFREERSWAYERLALAIVAGVSPSPEALQAANSDLSLYGEHAACTGGFASGYGRARRSADSFSGARREAGPNRRIPVLRAGLSVEEAAHCLGISPRAVNREWGIFLVDGFRAGLPHPGTRSCISLSCLYPNLMNP